MDAVAQGERTFCCWCCHCDVDGEGRSWTVGLTHVWTHANLGTNDVDRHAVILRRQSERP